MDDILSKIKQDNNERGGEDGNLANNNLISMQNDQKKTKRYK